MMKKYTLEASIGSGDNNKMQLLFERDQVGRYARSYFKDLPEQLQIDLYEAKQAGNPAIDPEIDDSEVQEMAIQFCGTSSPNTWIILI